MDPNDRSFSVVYSKRTQAILGPDGTGIPVPHEVINTYRDGLTHEEATRIAAQMNRGLGDKFQEYLFEVRPVL